MIAELTLSLTSSQTWPLNPLNAVNAFVEGGKTLLGESKHLCELGKILSSTREEMTPTLLVQVVTLSASEGSQDVGVSFWGNCAVAQVEKHGYRLSRGLVLALPSVHLKLRLSQLDYKKIIGCIEICSNAYFEDEVMDEISNLCVKIAGRNTPWAVRNVDRERTLLLTPKDFFGLPETLIETKNH